MIAVAATVSAVCTALVDSGLSAAVIRAPTLTRIDLETAWWLNMGLAAIFGGGLIALGPAIGLLVGKGELVDVLPLYALTVVVTAAASVPLALIQRRMAFRTRLWITLPASALGAMAAIGFAVVSPSVFALAMQPLVAGIVTVVILGFMRAHIVGFHFDRRAARMMLSFGLPLAGSSTIDTLWNGLPAVYIAAALGVTPAGIYFMADRLRNALVMTVFSAVATVAFPAFSTVAHDRRQFVSYIRSAIRASAALSAPVFLIVAVQAQNIFKLILGPEWSHGALYLSVMMVGAIMYPPNSVNIAAMKAAGRTKLILLLEVGKKVVVLALLVAVLPMGLVPYLWAMVAFGVVAYIPNSWFVSNSLDYRYRDQVADIGLPGIIGAAVAAILWGVCVSFSIPPAVAVFILSPLAIGVGWSGTLAITPSLRRVVSARISARFANIRGR
ncbi:hypothetical protein GCM10022240_14870 [Microbacterium kribbense]|uniref:Polysaccharide biosynthesis protein n=1 Tax=Microbacterium kribbense TaxID=433645 RepID=A0ABP7GGA9_9MICO